MLDNRNKMKKPMADSSIVRDYEMLKERGVNFVSEPAELPFGLQAQFTDPDGNLFSLAQPRTHPSG